jgi:hypothetical protein
MSGVSIDGGSRADRLLALAQAFANDMTERIGRIVPVSVRFSALATGSDTKYRVMVAVLDETFKAQSIPLAIGGKAKLRFLVNPTAAGIEVMTTLRFMSRGSTSAWRIARGTSLFFGMST